MATKSKATLEVEVWDQYGDDGDTRCAVCGEEIYSGDEMVWEPSPDISPNAIVSSHPGCAVRNGYAISRDDD